MGKGQFILEMARRNADKNFIGIEKYSSVLVRALEKCETFEGDNLRFIRMDAEKITEVFARHEVDGIYLNFSDPWPKDRHAKRRLTYRDYWSRYNEILKPEGEVIFKTDNRPLFDFSLEEVQAAGWELTDVTCDLHHSPAVEDNVMTEYEAKFSALGNPIHRLIARR
jgi:tRNA (guanine-N7-)-methyltransferase